MKNRLQCAQNKIIRYILNLSPITHIGLDEFKIVKMLPVEYRVQQLKLNHMYDIVNGVAPDYMSNLLEIPPIIISLETVLYHLPFHKFQLQV